MLTKIRFETEEQKECIINENTDKYLIEIQYLKNENFLIFSDVPTVEILQQEQGEKISILEAENETLKQELSITQDAVNELIFNSLNMQRNM